MLRRAGSVCGMAVALLLFSPFQSSADPVSEAVPETEPATEDTELDACDERTRAIVLQTKAARAGIDSYSMRIKWEGRTFSERPLDAALPEGNIDNYGEGVWTVKGEKWRVHCNKRWEVAQRLPGQVVPDIPTMDMTYERWTVYNGEYFAMYNSRFPNDIHLSPRNAIEAKLVKIKSELFPHPLTWGFGFGDGYLDVEYEKNTHSSTVRWETNEVESGDGPKLKLTRITPSRKTGNTLINEFVVDPLRDYLIVEASAYLLRKPPFHKWTFELQELPDGRWFPARVTVRELDRFVEYQVSDVVFNGEVDDRIFTIEAFGLNLENVRLDRLKLDGDHEKLLYRDGQWIPEAMVPESRRPVRPGAGVQLPDSGSRNR